MLNRTGTVVVGCAVGALLALPARAQEWTRFRGPNGSGISTAKGIPTAITEADHNWRVKLPGGGHSSPVLWGKKIFLTSAEPAAGKRHLLCLDAADGRTLWTRTYAFQPYERHGFNSFASATPAVDGDHVYAVWATPDSLTLHALDHTGKDVWTRELGKFGGNHGSGGSPVVYKDVVIYANDQEAPESFLIGLDRKTGKTLWQRPRTSGTAAYAAPIIFEPKSGPAEVIFTSTAHGLTSLDPLTGELNWEATKLFKSRPVATPVITGGLIFATAGTGGGEKQAFAVRPGSKADKTEPKVEYQLARGLSYVPSPIAFGDHLFLWGDQGLVTCVKATTGETVWMERVGGTGGNYFGSPVCVDGKLYAMSAGGELVVVEAGPQFKVVARSPLGEGSHSTPAVANGVMYLRTEGHLISVGGKKAAQQ